MIVEGNQTYVRRLRVSTNERDALFLRLHLDRILGAADLHPAGLPPSAIVCIRNLRVSTRLPLHFRDPRFAAEWKTAITSSLDQLVMRAARPAFEAVPADARAVIFLERAEMLACLASDWCNGLILARWWWQGLLRNAQAERVVKESWRRAAQYAPSALAQLAKKGKAVEFVRAWNNAEALGLLRDVIDSFALVELRPVVQLAKDTDRDRRPRQNYSSPPWQSWVPETANPELNVEQQLLLGIGLLLRRAPALVRASDFAGEARNWYAQVRARPVQEAQDKFEFADDRAANVAAPGPSVETENEVRVEQRMTSSPVPARKPELRVHASEIPAEKRVAGSAHFPKAQPLVSTFERFPQSPLPGEHDQVPQTVTKRPTEEVVGSLETKLGTNSVSRLDREPDRLVEVNPAALESDMPPGSEATRDHLTEVRDQVETEFGGIFYLINVGLYLNLYGDFTTPAVAGIELNIWDFVALVGEELTGNRADHIWPFLAGLAGREIDTPPGEGFVPPADWRVAPEWLSDFSTPAPWKWTANDHRLQVAHPEGFLVVDVPVADDPVRQLQTEIERYETALGRSISLEQTGEVFLETENVAPKAAPQLRRWLSRLMPYVRARLRVALGLKSNESPGSLLCRRYARVEATDTHIDVYFGLADLPLEIRLAGLDRDPGWVPAAGRFIAFHFD